MFKYFCLFFITTFSISKFGCINYNRYSNSILQSSIAVKTVIMGFRAYDALSCLSVCSYTLNCGTAYYNQANLSCSLYSVLSVQYLVSTTDPNSVIFMKPW